MTAAPEQAPHRGPTIFALGLIAFVCCFPLGLAIVWAGRRDLGQMDAGRMDPDGRGLVKTGIVLGVLSAVWQVVALVLWAVL